MRFLKKTKSMLLHYGIFSFGFLAIEKVFTLIFFTEAKIIRLPIDVRGRRNIKIGKNVSVGRFCRFEVNTIKGRQNAKIYIGNDVQINDRVHIDCCGEIKIDDNCVLASGIYIGDSAYGFFSGSGQTSCEEVVSERRLDIKPVQISRNCWIGENSIVLPGVNIGENVIVGAASVVTKSFGANQLIAGNPARVVKKFDLEKKVWVKA